jgi:hypothetical protein
MKQGQMSTIVSAEIFPGIGICRIGDSEHFYLSPEVPNKPPSGPKGDWNFRDEEGKIYRQGQRFRIYGYDDKYNIVSIDKNHKNVDYIEWHCTLANKKASFYQFLGGYTYNPILDGPQYEKLRNQHIQDNLDPNLRDKLHNVPVKEGLKLRTNSYKDGDKLEFVNHDDKTYFDGFEAPYLGELKADENGNLIVLGGKGVSKHTHGNGVMYDYVNNDNWYDDTSDGPVHATIHWKDGSKPLVCKSSWVMTAPPKYNITVRNTVTLHDIFLQTALKKEALGQTDWDPNCPISYYRDKFHFKTDLADRPLQYYRDIGRVLEMPAFVSWVNGKAHKFHGPNSNAYFMSDKWQAKLRDNSKENEQLRDSVYHRIRVPLQPKREEGGDWEFSADNSGMANEYYMPMLAGDGGERQDGNTSTFMAFPELVYDRLTKWKKGEFSVDDPNEYLHVQRIEDVDINQQPYCLDLATLEWTIGGPYNPGIEMTFNTYEPTEFSEPFRINRSKTAGDVSRYMAVPWQADFYECQVHWWPSTRPDIVVEETVYNQIALENPDSDLTHLLDARVRWATGIRYNPSHVDTYGVEPVWGDMDFTLHWAKMGFIVPKPHRSDHHQLSHDPRKNVLVQTNRLPDFRPYNQAIDPLKEKNDRNVFDSKLKSNALPYFMKLDVNDLKTFINEGLDVALRLELSTIPPYLFALYSINYLDSTESNDLAGISVDSQVVANNIYTTIKSIAVEEMLHAAIVANIMTSFGKYPTYYSQNSIMNYPCLLPNYKGDLMLNLWPATIKQIQNFANLEKPDDETHLGVTLWFDSIGEFYLSLELALTAYYHKEGDKLRAKAKDSAKFQVGNGMAYYPSTSDAGSLIKIHDLKDILNSIEVIRRQGEGQLEGDIVYTTDDPSGKEQSHYAKFVGIIEKAEAGDYEKHVNVLANGNVCVGLAITDDLSKGVVLTNRAFGAMYCLLLVALDNLWRTQDETRKVSISRQFHFPIMKVLLPQLSKILMTVPLVRRGGVDGRDWTEANAGPTFSYYDFKGKDPVKQVKQLVKEANGTIDHPLWETVVLTTNNLPEKFLSL